MVNDDGKFTSVNECVKAVLALSAEDIASVQAKLWPAVLLGK